MKLMAAPLSHRIITALGHLPRPSGRHTTAALTAVAVTAEAPGRASKRAARLCNTFFLAMPADEARTALKNLTLERFSLEFATIPATGGCVVAVFAPMLPEPDLFWRFRLARQQHDVARLLSSLGATVV